MSKLDQLKALGAAKLASRKNSRGDRVAGQAKVREQRPRADAGAAPSPRETDGGRVAGDCSAISRGVNRITGTREARSKSNAGLETGVTGGESAAPKSKGGRPLAKDADKALMRTQPWKAEGMSRATYYRRQAEKAK